MHDPIQQVNASTLYLLKHDVERDSSSRSQSAITESNSERLIVCLKKLYVIGPIRIVRSAITATDELLCTLVRLVLDIV